MPELDIYMAIGLALSFFVAGLWVMYALQIRQIIAANSHFRAFIQSSEPSSKDKILCIVSERKDAGYRLKQLFEMKPSIAGFGDGYEFREGKKTKYSATLSIRFEKNSGGGVI